MDAMAEAGVQTLYIQTAHTRSATAGVMEPERLAPIIQRAHNHRMHVVAWYLPTFEDVDADLQRLTESAALDVGGLAVDIESTAIADVAERNRRLLDLSDAPARRGRPGQGDRRHHAVGRAPPGGEPVVLAGVPVAGAGRHLRRPAPDELLDDPQGRPARRRRPTPADNLDRIRASVGDADIPIVPVGGLAEDSTIDDLEGMVAAIDAHGVARRRPVRLGHLDARAVGRARPAPRPPVAGARAGRRPTAQRAMPPATTSSPS